MNKKLLISLLIIIGLAVAGYFYFKKYKKVEIPTVSNKGTVENLIEKVAPKNPLEKLPDTNPVKKANPFKNLKTNPFK